MVIKHHDLDVPLDDQWWVDAGMDGFTPASSAYAVDKSQTGGRRVCLIAIRDIAPVRRSPGVPIFNDSHFEDITAAERVTRILRGFVAGAALPPIELVRLLHRLHRFKPLNGAHRLYCSLAAGFTHVPAVKGYGLAALDNPEEDDTDDQDLC